jgi:hypothetical protein
VTAATDRILLAAATGLASGAAQVAIDWLFHRLMGS